MYKVTLNDFHQFCTSIELDDNNSYELDTLIKNVVVILNMTPRRRQINIYAYDKLTNERSYTIFDIQFAEVSDTVTIRHTIHTDEGIDGSNHLYKTGDPLIITMDKLMKIDGLAATAISAIINATREYVDKKKGSGED